MDAYIFEEYEVVLFAKTVNIASRSTSTGKKELVIVGTGFMRGEDLNSRGKVYLFDVIEVVPEPGKPETKSKLKLIYVNEEKGPVTAATDCNGYLALAIGQKVIFLFYSWYNFENLEEKRKDQIKMFSFLLFLFFIFYA